MSFQNYPKLITIIVIYSLHYDVLSTLMLIFIGLQQLA